MDVIKVKLYIFFLFFIVFYYVNLLKMINKFCPEKKVDFLQNGLIGVVTCMKFI